MGQQIKRRVRQQFIQYWRDDSGATAIEYGLIAALIGLAIVGSVRSYTNAANSMWNKVSTEVTGAL